MTVVQSKVVKKARKKSAAQRLWNLHWWMTFFYLVLFIGGKYMVDLVKSPESISRSYLEAMFDIHKTLGVLVMSLLLTRIYWLLWVTLKKYRRRKPKHKKGWLTTVIIHIILYFFMFLVPLSGYFDSNIGGYDVKIFATGIVLPPLFPANEQWQASGFANSVHFWLSYTFLAFIILHMIDQKKYLRAQLRRFSKATLGKLS